MVVVSMLIETQIVLKTGKTILLHFGMLIDMSTIPMLLMTVIKMDNTERDYGYHAFMPQKDLYACHAREAIDNKYTLAYLMVLSIQNHYIIGCIHSVLCPIQSQQH